MGDLCEACSVRSYLFRLLMSIAMQLKPIPIATDDAITYNKVPAFLQVNGSVTFVDEPGDCFNLTPSQYVSGGSQSDALPICALMDCSSPFPSSTQNLPEFDWLVGFTGWLLSFEGFTEPGSVHHLHAKVLVVTISHLTIMSDVPLSRKPVNVVDDEDSVVLKEWVSKYAQKKPTVVEEKEFSVGSSKGKRKVTLSLNGVGGKPDWSNKKRR